MSDLPRFTPRIVSAFPFTPWVSLCSPDYGTDIVQREPYLNRIKTAEIEAVWPGTKTRYYISSLPGNARQILHAVRSHWEIENELH